MEEKGKQANLRQQQVKQITQYTFRLSPPPRSTTFLYRLNKLIAMLRDDRYSSSDGTESYNRHCNFKILVHKAQPTKTKSKHSTIKLHSHLLAISLKPQDEGH